MQTAACCLGVGGWLVPLLCRALPACSKALCRSALPRSGLATWGVQKAASSDMIQSPAMVRVALLAALSIILLGPGIHVLAHQVTPDAVPPCALKAGVDKGWPSRLAL